MADLARLPSRADDGAVRLVIESPRGSMVKLGLVDQAAKAYAGGAGRRGAGG